MVDGEGHSSLKHLKMGGWVKAKVVRRGEGV